VPELAHLGIFILRYTNVLIIIIIIIILRHGKAVLLFSQPMSDVRWKTNQLRATRRQTGKEIC